VKYTRGLDLSRTRNGAGGIGGLLARTDANGSTFYHSDGAGNVTALMDGYEIAQARYLYGPFGKLTGKWGQLSDANSMQFSSMPRHANSGLTLYPFRGYDATLQRFLTQDPIGEAGGINLYGFVGNSPLNAIDPLGLDFHSAPASGLLTPGPFTFYSGDTTIENLGASVANTLPEAGNLLSSAGDGLVNGLSALDQATENVLTALFDGDQQLGQAANNALAATPLGLPEDLGKLGRLGKALSKACKVPEKVPKEKLKFKPSERRRAPIGSDGKPVELHHMDQKLGNDSPRSEMTQTDHRGEGNYTENHPNTGQDPSTVDRSESSQQHKDYWNQQWDSGRFDNLPKQP
jgi:RHS repeat-associated protein